MYILEVHFYLLLIGITLPGGIEVLLGYVQCLTNMTKTTTNTGIQFTQTQVFIYLG